MDQGIVIALYFLPTVIAMARKVRWGGIFLVNLFAGWTGVGWLVCMFWACRCWPVGAARRGPVVEVSVWRRRGWRL